MSKVKEFEVILDDFMLDLKQMKDLISNATTNTTYKPTITMQFLLNQIQIERTRYNELRAKYDRLKLLYTSLVDDGWKPQTNNNDSPVKTDNDTVMTDTTAIDPMQCNDSNDEVKTQILPGNIPKGNTFTIDVISKTKIETIEGLHDVGQSTVNLVDIYYVIYFKIGKIDFFLN